MTLRIVAPENLLLSKLEWYRDSESEIQQRDLKNLMESVTDLDWDYTNRWATELGLSEALERVRR